MHGISDYIVVLDDVLPVSVCDAILNEYKNSDEWVQTEIGSGVDLSIRSATTIEISRKNVIDRNEYVRSNLDAKIFEAVKNAIQIYARKFPHCHIQEDSGYELLRYKTGQFYKEHTDSFKGRPRAVSCSLSLNDGYEGGEFGFFGREKIVKAKKGGAVMFPSNFMFPHEILPVSSGTRYSIITWFI